MRAFYVVSGGAFVDLGGASITVGFLGAFSDGVVAGRGYRPEADDHRRPSRWALFP